MPYTKLKKNIKLLKNIKMHHQITNGPRHEKIGFMSMQNGADRLCSDHTANQRLCFHYTNSTIALLLTSEISRFLPASVTVQVSLCHTAAYLLYHKQKRMRYACLDGNSSFRAELMSHLVRKPTMWFPNRSDRNRPI